MGVGGWGGGGGEELGEGSNLCHASHVLIRPVHCH